MSRPAELARSHSIFTLILEQRNRKCGSAEPAAVDYYVTAKFHLVDLAGSERAKRLDPQSSWTSWSVTGGWHGRHQKA